MVFDCGTTDILRTSQLTSAYTASNQNCTVGKFYTPFPASRVVITVVTYAGL